MPHRNNVLARLPRPTTKSYQDAVREIILSVQGDMTDEELAERLGCSKGTVRNARDRNGCLNGVTLANIEYEFGPAAIDPFMALGGSRAMPKDAKPSAADVTVPLSCALHNIILTQAKDSPGGAETLAEEVTPILDELREARTALDALIALAEAGQ